MKNIYFFLIGILLFITGIDISAQTFDPARGATDVTNSPIITITFPSGSTVDFGSGNSIVVGKSWNAGDYIELKTGPRPSRDSRLSIINDTIVQIDLSGDELDYSTEYFVSSMEHDVIVVNGNGWDNLYDDTYYRFTTEAPPTPPSITNYDPELNSSTVRVNDTLKLTFNENIELGTAGSVVIKYYSDDTEFETIGVSNSKVSVTDNVLYITHTEFGQDVQFYVLMNSGFVKSVATGTDFPGISDKNDWFFTTIKVRNWEGGTSSDFTDVSNWDSNGSFVDGAVLNIPSSSSYKPVISSGTVNIADLIIEAGGGLTINNGVTVNVDSIIELKSSVSANAYLLCNGTLNYTASNVKIHQKISSSSRWYYVSSPVNNATKNNIGCTGSMYYWDNASGSWTVALPNATMETGKGYILKNSSDLMFTGTITTGNDTVDLNYGKSVGWNLIGNPYTNSIDWNYVTITDSVFDGFWLYKNLDDLYGSFNGTTGDAVNLNLDPKSTIPSNHCFWVRSDDETTTQTVTFTAACKSTVTGSYLKSESANSEFPLLKFSISNGDYVDEVIISFSDTLSTPLSKLDMTKKFSDNTEFVQPYFTRGKENLCMIGLPKFYNDTIVPFGVRFAQNSNPTGTYSIRSVKAVNFPEDIVISIYDKKEDIKHDLLHDGPYEFVETSTGDITDRFEIIFQGDIATDIEDIRTDNKGIDDNVTILPGYRQLEVKTDNQTPVNIEVYNISGQTVGVYNNVVSGRTIPIPTKGIYLVRVKSNNDIITKKVFVK